MVDTDVSNIGISNFVESVTNCETLAPRSQHTSQNVYRDRPCAIKRPFIRNSKATSALHYPSISNASDSVINHCYQGTMQLFTLAPFALLAAFAIADGSSGSSGSGGTNQLCGNGEKTSCCNSGKSKLDNSIGIEAALCDLDLCEYAWLIALNSCLLSF